MHSVIEIEEKIRQRYRQPKGVEQFGIEPVPTELKTVRWHDIFAIIFGFALNPGSMLVGGMAVVSGLSFWGAIGAITCGILLATIAYTITATVGTPAGAALPSSGDGTVTFYDGATVLGTATFSGAPGTATLTTAALAPGDHVFTAQYSGASSFQASNSGVEPNSAITAIQVDGASALYVLAVDGSGRIAAELAGPPEEAELLGTWLADELIAEGARELLQR